MTKCAQKVDLPLVQRPIEEITRIARDAGRTAFGNPEIAAVLWMEARFHWINENFSSSLGLTDDEFDAVLSIAGRGFEEGIDKYLRAAADDVAALA